jgi:chromosome partitioning protein
MPAPEASASCPDGSCLSSELTAASLWTIAEQEQPQTRRHDAIHSHMHTFAIARSNRSVRKTTAVNLAAALASTHRRGLLVDLDAQASASMALGVPRVDLRPSAAEVFLEGHSIRQAIRGTAVAGLDLLTGSMGLVNADLVLADVRSRERRVHEALSPIGDDYAFMVLDCPPSLGLLPMPFWSL